MSKKISRRDFLKMGMVTVAGGVLAGCGGTTPTPAPQPEVEETAAPEPQATDAPVETAPDFGGATVVLMYPGGEFTEDYRNEVAAKYNITFEFLEEDRNRLNQMWAAGAPPDIYRPNAVDSGNEAIRNRLLPLDAYIDASTIVRRDDLMDCVKQHQWTGPVVGAGPIYGIPKDWGPDFIMYYNKEYFDAAGVPVPSADTPVTWQELAALAPQLTVTEGDRTIRWGVESHYWAAGGPAPQFLLEMLPQVDGAAGIYAEDMASINLVNNEAAKAVFQFIFDLAQQGAAPSPINNHGTWFGQAFQNGALAMCQGGYWFGPMITQSEVTAGKCVAGPAPLWTTPDKRRNSSVWATATVIASRSLVPDAAWRVVEYFSGDRPAVDRAMSGWGVPALRSLVDLLPQETEFDQQRYAVLQGELEYAGNALKYNPYEKDLKENSTYLEQALRGDITLDEAIAGIEEATNASIQDMIERLS